MAHIRGPFPALRAKDLGWRGPSRSCSRRRVSVWRGCRRHHRVCDGSDAPWGGANNPHWLATAPDRESPTVRRSVTCRPSLADRGATVATSYGAPAFLTSPPYDPTYRQADAIHRLSPSLSPNDDTLRRLHGTVLGGPDSGSSPTIVRRLTIRNARWRFIETDGARGHLSLSAS